MDELNMMREQMAAMKSSLAKYEIVNDRLMRTVMRQRASWINNLVAVELVLVPIMIIFFFGLVRYAGVSKWIAAVIGILLIASAVIDLRTMRITPAEITNLSLKSLRDKLIRQKHLRRLQFMIELPLMALWSIWFFYDYFNMAETYASSRALFWACAVVTVFLCLMSCLLAYWVYRKANRTSDNLIGQIDSSSADDESEQSE